MKVLLLHLPLVRRSWLGQFSLPEPLAQMYLAPVLADRHELRLVDLRVTPRLEQALDGWRPEAVIVGVNPLYYAAADRSLALLRELFPRLRILLCADAEYGNGHVSERPLDFAHPLADALVEPYFLAPLKAIVVETLAAWDEGRSIAEVPGLWVQTSPGNWSPTESVPNRAADIGVPDRKPLGRARGSYRFAGIGRMAHLFYTYGCRYKCRFCPMSKHDGSVVARSLDDVVAELSELTEPHVFLEDFEPFLAPEAMSRLADAVEGAGIRKHWYMLTRSDTALEQEDLIRRWQGLGLRWLYLGLDGASPERLKEIKKATTVGTNEKALARMSELGLCVSGGFVVRSDFTLDDFRALRTYVRRLRSPLVGFTVETPFVGTALFDEREKSLTTRDWSLFDMEHAVLPTVLPLDVFYREMTRLHVANGLRATPSMLRHYPLRDLVRIWAGGARGVLGARRSARDHEHPTGLGRGPRARRARRAPAAAHA